MQFLQRSWRNFIYGISHIYMYTAKSKNSIMLSHNNIYQDLQTIDNHVELIILRRWENFLKGAVKKTEKTWTFGPLRPFSFFLSMRWLDPFYSTRALLASCTQPFHTAKAASAALGSIFAMSELLRHMCHLESATNIVVYATNIENIHYKLVLNFYLKFCSSRMGLSRFTSSSNHQKRLRNGCT